VIESEPGDGLGQTLVVPTWRGHKIEVSWGKAICVLAIAVYTLGFTYLQIQLYRGLRMGITDLGYFDQSMYNTLHNRVLQVSFDIPSSYRQIQSSNSPHLFAQHPFVLMILLVLPFYALAPHTYTLFLIQAFAAAIGALPIYLLAREKLGDEWPAVALSLAYLLHPTLQFITVNMYTFGFHPENLFPPLFLFAFYFLYKEKWLPFWVFFLLSVLVVDSYTLVCAALGVYVILTRPKRWLVGVGMIAISLAWLALSLKVIVPYFKVGGGSPWFVNDMKGGQVILEKLGAFPGLVPPLLEYLGRVGAPFLFLPFVGLPVLAIALPILGVNFSAMLIGYGAPASYTGWQSNPIVPILALAAIWGLAWLQKRLSREKIRLISAAVLGVAVICDLWYGPLPFSLDTMPGQYDVNTARSSAVERLRRVIPESAVLSADYYLGSQFTRRPWLYWFPDHWADADYVLVDRSSEWSQVYAQQLAWLENSPYHQLAFDREDLVLYRRLADPLPPQANALEANFGNQAKLMGYTVLPESSPVGNTLRVVLYWSSLGPTPVPYTVFVHLLDPSGRQVSQKDSMPMSNLRPTTDWRPGETLADGVYELPIPAQSPPGEYALEVGLYHLASGKRLNVLDPMGNPQDTKILIRGVPVGAP